MDKISQTQVGQGAPMAYITKIQQFINELPWDNMDLNKPNLPLDGLMGQKVHDSLNILKKIGEEAPCPTLINAINTIQSGDVQKGSLQLADAKDELVNIFEQNEKYRSAIGDKKWTYQDKLQYLQSSQYPNYFPKPWQPKNSVSYNSADKYGEFELGALTPELYRVGQTPKYNHFLLWGPEYPGEGINGPDPRLNLIKSKYPEVFSHEQLKARLQAGEHSPIISSPGVKPYTIPPQKGSYYTDPHNPKTSTEGMRFFDEEDENLYYTYLEAFNKFKEQEGDSAKQYNDLYLTYKKDWQSKTPKLDYKIKEASSSVDEILKLADDFEEKLNESEFKNYYSDDNGRWLVQTLWEAAKDLPVHKVSVRPLLKELHDLKELLTDPDTHDEEMERVKNADLSYPIILTPDGHICDGCHRTLKVYLSGHKMINAVQLQEMPPADG
jgi:hypothetical protein